MRTDFLTVIKIGCNPDDIFSESGEIDNYENGHFSWLSVVLKSFTGHFSFSTGRFFLPDCQTALLSDNN